MYLIDSIDTAFSKQMESLNSHYFSEIGIDVEIEQEIDLQLEHFYK